MSSILDEKRGLIKRACSFYTTKTVPTVRITFTGDIPVLELGKRCRIRENSLKDSMDKKGWDITSSPVPMIHGNNLEMGYITHPAGCTVQLIPKVKVMAADDNGDPVQVMVPKMGPDGKPEMKDDKPVMIPGFKYIEANFEGVIGTGSDTDDFNESTEREQSRGWLIPFIVGGVIGVFGFAPMFAWVMGWIAQRAAGL